MPRRGFRGLTEVAGLSDARARLLVLGNWHKLNTVLRTRPTSAELRRLLALEVASGRGARANVVERLRSAVCRAESRERRPYARVVSRCLKESGSARRSDLLALGLDPGDARRLGK